MVRSTNHILLHSKYNAIVSAYNKGYFTKNHKVCKIPKRIVSDDIIEEIDTDNGIYSEISNLRSTDIYATAGHVYYTYFHKHGVMPKGGRCDWCKRDFDTTVLGYPRKYEKKIITIEDVRKLVNIFWIEGTFCSFPCILSFINRFHDCSNLFDSCSSAQCKIQLSHMFSLSYPNENLSDIKEKPDPSLLIENGGSLTYEQWLSEKYVFVPNNKVIFAPIEKRFLIKNLSEQSDLDSHS